MSGLLLRWVRGLAWRLVAESADAPLSFRVTTGLGPSELGRFVALKLLEDSFVEHAVPSGPWKHGTDAVHSLR